MVSKYRWPAIGCSAATAVLSGFTIWFIWILYTGYRTKDFTDASIGPETKTCVEAASLAQIDSLGIKNESWSCTDRDKERLADVLAANVHAMYAANAAAQYANESAPVYNAVLLAAQGVDTTYTITRAGAYAVLSKLGTPSSTDCATLYPGATEQENETSPIAVTVACDDDVPLTNNAPTPALNVDVLYTHCLQQFSYGRSWPKTGTFGIPVVGTEAKPVFLPLPTVNSTTSWEDRQRVLVGTRWGYSTIVYVLLVLTSAFFLMDSTILLLAELTRVRGGRRIDHTTHLPNAKRFRLAPPLTLPLSPCPRRRSTPTSLKMPSRKAARSR